MSGTLALAASIAGMDRPALERLASARRPASPVSVQDPISLATELLRPESVTRAIERLDRASLTVLVELSAGAEWADKDHPTLDPLVGIGLVGEDRGAHTALPEVTEAVHRALANVGAALDSPFPAVSAEPALSAAEQRADWYGPALITVQRTAALLRAMREHPVRLNRRGTVPIAAARALAEGCHADETGIRRLLHVLEQAGLLTRDATGEDRDTLLTTAVASRWFTLPHTRRWLVLATALLTGMSAPLRDTLGSCGGDLELAAGAALAHRYPLLPEAEREAADEFSETAADLGLTQAGVLTRAAEAVLAGDDASALRAAEQTMPEAATGLYLQPDLSIVVPAPLAPADEEQLFALADIEQLGIASTLRITAASLTRAFTSGRTADEARRFLARVSLTGIPQPLDFLLDDVAGRLGSFVVHEHHGDEGRTRVGVVRPQLLEAMLVDRSLQHLQLRPDSAGTAAFSRVRPEHVLATLTDARYPAVAGAASGQSEPQNPDASIAPGPPAARDSLAAPTALSLPRALRDMVDRVWEAARMDPEASDATRRLELAIRDRVEVLVTASARGQQRTFTLLPVALRGGRLRATDQAAGVERTLPVSAITEVRPVE